MRSNACLALGLVVACQTSLGADFEPPSAVESSGAGPAVGSSGSSSSAAEPAADATGASPDGPIYDVGGGDRCVDAEPGLVCSDGVAVLCDAAGMEVDAQPCAPGECQPGIGCVACVEGQITCAAEKLLRCDATVEPPTWVTLEVCDPSLGEVCDLATQSCAISEPIGEVTPTGEYYEFADFGMGTSAFRGGFDVDGIGDRIYVHSSRDQVDVYTLELLDSDGDGQFEPGQHPQNPDHPGPIEERVLTFDSSFEIEGGFVVSAAELFVTESGIYIGGSAGITENAFGGASNIVAPRPAWIPFLEHLGYDENTGRWYASHQHHRRVYQYDSQSATWGIAFDYPVLAGEHMDGLEVVTDPNQGIAYVYVSDMTSDFLGQYRFDAEHGWVQENLFEYAGTTGVPVEGMGFGPLDHFWATGAGRLYEIGGGALSIYTEPAG